MRLTNVVSEANNVKVYKSYVWVIFKVWSFVVMSAFYKNFLRNQSKNDLKHKNKNKNINKLWYCVVLLMWIYGCEKFFKCRALFAKYL
jgi:amino acid permease